MARGYIYRLVRPISRVALLTVILISSKRIRFMKLEAYQVRKSTVKKGDIIRADLAPGGGHCIWIRLSE